MSVGPAGVASGLRQSLWVPGVLPGLNEIISLARRRAGKAGSLYDKEKARLTNDIAMRARAAKMKPVRRCWMMYAWTAINRRHDPSNLVVARKFIEDGLVLAEVLAGDGWKHIVGIQDVWTVDPARPGVLVVLEEAAI